MAGLIEAIHTHRQPGKGSKSIKQSKNKKRNKTDLQSVVTSKQDD